MSSATASLIESLLGSPAGRRTLARKMVRPIMSPVIPSLWKLKECEDCGRFKICEGTSLSAGSGYGYAGDCWRPVGCLLVWDV
jgi:hypothetical protein